MKEPINESGGDPENKNSLRRDNSKRLKNLNLKKTPPNISPKRGLLSKNSDRENFKNRRKSNKNLKSPQNDSKQNLDKNSKYLPTEVINIEHKNQAHIFTNTNPVIQIDKGISVSESALKPKFLGLSKSCKNLHIGNKHPNSDLIMPQIPSNFDINVAFFSDDENVKIPKIKMLYSLLKKYKNVD